MKKEKVGLLIFWIAVIWILSWGIIGSLFLTPVYRNLTIEEVNQTMWASNGIWFMIWGLYGVPLGAIIALIGVLLNVGAKVSTALKYGIYRRKETGKWTSGSSKNQYEITEEEAISFARNCKDDLIKGSNIIKNLRIRQKC